MEQFHLRQKEEFILLLCRIEGEKKRRESLQEDQPIKCLGLSRILVFVLLRFLVWGVFRLVW